MHKVQVTPLIGLPQFDGWSQVAANEDGTLTVALSVSGVNAGNVGRQLLSDLIKTHPNSAAELHSSILDLLHAATTVASQVALAASCVIGERSMFAAYQGSIMLKRGEKAGAILTAPDSVKVLEGKHTLQDVIVLLTNPATTYIGEIQQKLTQGFDEDTIVTSMVSAIHSHDSSALSCLAFISFQEQGGEELENSLFEFKIEEVREQLSPLLAKALPQLPTDFPLASTPQVVVESLNSEILLPQPVFTPKSLASFQLQFSSAVMTKVSSTIKRVSKGLIGGLKVLTQKISTGLRNTPQLLNHLRRQAQSGKFTSTYVTQAPKITLLKIIVPALIVVGLLVGGVLAYRGQVAQQVRAAEIAVAPLEQQFEVAKKKVGDSPLVARAEMEKIVSELEVVKTEFSGQRAAEQLIEQRLEAAKASYDELSGREELSALPVYLDLRTIQSDFIVTRADANATQAALLDAEKKQFIILNLATKETQTRALLDAVKLVHLSVSNTSVVTIGNGIRQFSVTDNEAPVTLVKEEGDSNREGSLVGTFGQFIYVVNGVKRNIYRYAPSKDGYSDPIGWLQPGQSLPYDELISMAIDGNVWLTTRTGQILKLAAGRPEPFEPKGLPQEFKGPVTIYTKEELKYLYVLEPSAGRVVVLQKTGEFVKQIKSASLSSANSILVNEAAAKAYALSGSLIFEVTL